MITTKKLLSGLIAAGVVSLGTSSAALTTAQGDLLLSFYTVNGTSVGANAYTINLGRASSFLSSGPQTLVNINSDLTTAFGASWATNTQLTLNLIGGYDSVTSNGTDAARTIYAGSKLSSVTDYGTSTAAKATSAANQRTWATNVSGFSDAQNGRAAGGAVAANSAIITTASLNDVTDYNPPVASGTYYGIGWNPTSTIVSGDIGTFGGATYEAAFDLWRADYAAWNVPVYVTSLGLTSSGDLNIVAAAAVPEPSTFAMAGLAALTAGFVAIRRKKKQVQTNSL
jgi:hypothetical protein